MTPTLSTLVPVPGVNRAFSCRAYPARALPESLGTWEADAIGFATGIGTSTFGWLLVGLGPAYTGEMWVGGLEHPLARRAAAFETGVPPRYQELLIAYPGERTSHGA